MAPTVYTPPVSTYTPIATITLASTDSEIVFSSIPATYRDLVFVISGQLTNATATDTTLRVNGDSGSNYSRVYMYGSGVTATSGSATLTSFLPWYTRNSQSNSFGQIMDYSATDKHKTLLVRSNNAATDGTSAQAQRWANNAAINSLTFATTNAYAAGTTFSLYGISA